MLFISERKNILNLCFIAYFNVVLLSVVNSIQNNWLSYISSNSWVGCKN
jgi:hypothetical protein